MKKREKLSKKVNFLTEKEKHRQILELEKEKADIRDELEKIMKEISSSVVNFDIEKRKCSAGKAPNDFESFQKIIKKKEKTYYNE